MTYLADVNHERLGPIPVYLNRGFPVPLTHKNQAMTIEDI